MTREEIKNTPEVVDRLLDKCVLVDSRAKLRKRLEEVCDMAIKALEKQEPCEDAISRQKVNVLIDELARAISDERCFMSRGRSNGTIMKDILDLPSITPHYTEAEIQKIQELEQAEIQKAYELGKVEQPKTGHWIRVDKDKLKCSECEVIHFIAQYPQSAKINYCPNCGLKMEVEE